MTIASREFQVMVKPGGAICNLGCQYCYYLKKQDLYPRGELFRMTDDLLETYVVQHIEACPTEFIHFSWHGGEPTILGIDFFRKVVEIQRKHRPPYRKITNSIQTNGTFIGEDWCRFFAAEGFYVGLSLDGPRELHDAYRVTKGERPTHAQVMRAWRLLQKHHVNCDVLCVVHDQNVRHPGPIYRFFKEIGVRYLQFLPLVNRDEDRAGCVTPESVPAEAYGSFLSTIFKEWVRHDVGRIVIQLFDESVRPFLGAEHALCHYRETCGDVPVLEHNGDYFTCDHYVDRDHCLGNIHEIPLAEMIESQAQLEFGQAKRARLPRQCRECDVLAFCNGGCPKDRFIRTPDGEEGLNYLCAGLKHFFSEGRSYFEKLATLMRAGQPVEEIMPLLRADDPIASAQVGRNDPCPCGSGLKFKRCCIGKAGA